jgi:hypothetical protein
MFHIDSVEDSYVAVLVQGEGLTLEFTFRDAVGTTHKASVSGYALESLGGMLLDAQRSLLDHLSEGIKGDVSMSLHSGNTRGDCYISGTQ